jgi:hypothetical protein
MFHCQPLETPNGYMPLRIFAFFALAGSSRVSVWAQSKMEEKSERTKLSGRDGPPNIQATNHEETTVIDLRSRWQLWEIGKNLGP